MTRIGNWMQTFGGRQFWPLDPRPEEVFIEDIAHALSLLTRYNGHCLNFYSVAEHSVLVSRNSAPEDRLWGLLHDGSEAYITDIIRPLKPHLQGYYALESMVQECICSRFGLAPGPMPKSVKDADNRILGDECAQNMSTPPAPWEDFGPPLGVTLRFLNPKQAEEEFLSEFLSLTNVQQRKN